MLQWLPQSTIDLADQSNQPDGWANLRMGQADRGGRHARAASSSREIDKPNLRLDASLSTGSPLRFVKGVPGVVAALAASSSRCRLLL